MNNQLTVLFDYDSIIFMGVYKVVDIPTIREWFRANRTREWMEQEIVNLGLNRLSQMGWDFFDNIEEKGIVIGDIEYYITTAKRSHRKESFATYKANRNPKMTMRKWTSKMRTELQKTGFAICSDTHEADDLIATRARELGVGNYLILSMDKDMQQIEGIHFNYYRKPSKEVDEHGFKIMNPYRGLSIITPLESLEIFWKSMLTGDTADNIKGCKGIGPKTADKLLDGLKTEEDFINVVVDTYQRKHGEDWESAYAEAYTCLKLGMEPIVIPSPSVQAV